MTAVPTTATTVASGRRNADTTVLVVQHRSAFRLSGVQVSQVRPRRPWRRGRSLLHLQRGIIGRAGAVLPHATLLDSFGSSDAVHGISAVPAAAAATASPATTAVVPPVLVHHGVNHGANYCASRAGQPTWGCLATVTTLRVQRNAYNNDACIRASVQAEHHSRLLLGGGVASSTEGRQIPQEARASPT